MPIRWQTNNFPDFITFHPGYRFDLKYIDPRRYEFAARALDEISRMAGGWMKASRAEKTPQPV